MSRKRVAILSYILAIVLGIGSISIIPFNSTRASEVNYENAVNGQEETTESETEENEEDAKVSPTPTPIPVVSTPRIKLNKSKLKLTAGKSAQLKVSHNTSNDVKWVSLDEKIVTVSSSGIVKAKKAGNATIQVSCGEQLASCKVTVFKKLSSRTIQKKILALKNKQRFREGKPWPNKNSAYYWKINNLYCSECAAYAAIISDKVFGKSRPIKKHKSFAKIKPGDHIRIGNMHSVIVIKKSGKVLTVTEGNYNSTVHWGRKISKSELKSEGFYVETRY